MKNTLLAPLLLLLLLLTTQCGRPEDPATPGNLLPREKMVSMIIDLHLLETRVENSRLPADSARALYLQQMAGFYKQYGTTEKAFQESFTYYSIHNKDMEEIYAVVVDSLEKRSLRLEGQK